MTGPQARLAAIAGWDGAEVHAGVARLAAVADDLPTWRLRIERIGGRLRDGAWSGRAGDAAAGSTSALGAVAAALSGGLTESLAACRRAAVSVGAAAATARVARDADRSGADEGQPFAALALEQAADAAAALAAADAALAGLAVRDAFAPADFAELSDRVLPLPLPVPPSADPPEVAAWWTALPLLAQDAFLARRAALAGALDGLPGVVRDRANRVVLDVEMSRPDPSPTARAVAAELAVREGAGATVQLLLFDEGGERVALGIGDVDTADAVAVLVPGIGTTPDDDLGAVTSDVARAVGAAQAAGAGSVAGVAWLGYRPPRGIGILLRGRAGLTGPGLAAALDGMAAARAAQGTVPARTTVLAHSYGTVVVDEAADGPGRLAADAVVLLGSPGMEPDAPSLEVGEVYDAASTSDPISWSGWFGRSPWADPYGAEELPVAAGTGHSGYLDPGPTLTAVGGVIAGRR